MMKGLYTDMYIVENSCVSTGEFGVVYRARLGSKGISGQEVAVKTLKGLFKFTTFTFFDS